MKVEESGLGEERVADKPLGARQPTRTPRGINRLVRSVRHGLYQQVDRTATMNPVLICLLVMVTFFFLLCDAARTGLAQGRAISPSP